MKKIFISIFSLVIVALLFTSCDTTPDDFMTGDVQTGGLVAPAKSIPYKLGGTASFGVKVDIPQGPGIVAIEVYKTFTGKATVLDRTVDIASENANADVSKTFTYTYANLIQGLSMPANELLLNIGDAWTLSYVSVMEDGRKVLNSAKTNITVANKYAGNYQAVGTFTHPTAGARPINEVKFLTPIDANSCWANAGDLGASGYFVTVTVDPVTNKVTCSAGPGSAAPMANFPGDPTSNYYDPATGKFHLSYFYVGGSGNRIMREVWTPKP
ncbi:MAG: DUF4361 domain-containing protein [Gelidibacter sp.]|nr:DUF4361 domain-containing protein [Gelidibacter sp.]